MSCIIKHLLIIIIVVTSILTSSCEKKENHPQELVSPTKTLESIVETSNKPPTITWVVADAAPISYYNNENSTLIGYGIEIIEQMKVFLPQYNHKIFCAGNYKRVLTEISNNDFYVGIDIIKTPEREKTFVFSQSPAFLFLNLQLVMREDSFVKLKSPKIISLREILTTTNLVLGISKGRSHSHELDKIIEEFKDSNSIKIIAQGNIAEDTAKMLLSSRIDLMLMYPEEINHLFSKIQGNTKIYSIPIKETSAIGFSFFVAKNSQQGIKLLEEIDKAHKMIKQTSEYLSTYENSLPKDLAAEYRRLFDQYLLK
ncbi:MAG: transporter substrate-binding domain-containing protein [Spirochaetales bacterium]|nr:transporter substrate-binding domain-containing protein [Spirochaetales bacterium]